MDPARAEQNCRPDRQPEETTMSVIFNLPGYERYTTAFRNFLDGSTIGEIERKPFPDGELGLRLVTPVRGEDVILVGATNDAAATMEIFDLGCAIAKYGARSLTLVVPFYGCSTMER